MRPLLLMGLVLGPAACSGNGQGLDQNGNPVTSGGNATGTLTADFQSIQDNIFTPICSQCHIGAGAPEGLDLAQGQSYVLLVNVPSAEVPSLNRVTPSDPDGSYMVQKIMGTAAVGKQMPYGCPQTQPCLDDNTISIIRQWVSDGALPASGGEDPAAAPDTATGAVR
jgi:hypothetical protein